MFLNSYGRTFNFKSYKLNEISGGITLFQFICQIDSIDINPHICQKKTDLQFCLRITQHQCNTTTRVVETFNSSQKRIKNPERGKGSMSELLGGSPTIITSVSADIFDAKTDVVHQHKEASDDDRQK